MIKVWWLVINLWWVIICVVNINSYLILPMKYGAISVKYISYFLKMNMKVGGVKTDIYFKGLLEKFDKCKTTFCWILFWKLSRMIENGLTKKINLNTNIFNSVINAIQTFKELVTWRHNVALIIACKTRQLLYYWALYNCSCVASKSVCNHFSLIMKLNKKVISLFSWNMVYIFTQHD
jgi:hypothetical protein